MVVGASDGTLAVFMLPPCRDRLVLLAEAVPVSAGPVLCVGLVPGRGGRTAAAGGGDGREGDGGGKGSDDAGGSGPVVVAGTTDGTVTLLDAGPCLATAGAWLADFADAGGLQGECAVVPVGSKATAPG